MQSSQTARNNSVITRYLAQHDRIFVVYAGFAAFMTYLCMYAVRKPFSALSYEGMDFFGISINDNLLSLKVMLGVSQVIGYFISKVMGTVICSEISWAGRHRLMNLLLVLAIASLGLFWILPGPWKVFAMFLNGLPLGMVWGLVVGFLEGRRRSEVLLATLSISFIIGSGIVKDVGKWLVAAPPAEGIEAAQWLVLAGGMLVPFLYPTLASWFSSGQLSLADGSSTAVLQGFGLSWEAMPLAVALLFFPCFLLTSFLLSLVPHPTQEDEVERQARQPMDSNARWEFYTRFMPGLTLLFFSYFLLTAYRDYHDYFGQELFAQLGYADQPAIFTETALPVALGVITALALLSFIRSNFWGLAACFGLMLIGMLVQAIATFGFQGSWIDGKVWMVLVSLGAYLAYVPYSSVIFDRIIAKTRFAGTSIFAIYLADATGYLGSIIIKLFADFNGSGQADRLSFFIAYTWLNSFVGLVCFSLACVYFLRTGPTNKEPGQSIPTKPSLASA